MNYMEPYTNIIRIAVSVITDFYRNTDGIKLGGRRDGSNQNHNYSNKLYTNENLR